MNDSSGSRVTGIDVLNTWLNSVVVGEEIDISRLTVSLTVAAGRGTSWLRNVKTLDTVDPP